MKSIPTTFIFLSKTKFHAWLVKRKAKTGPRQGCGSGDVSSILDVWEKDAKANFKENFNGKSYISKDKGTIVPLCLPLSGTLQ